MNGKTFLSVCMVLITFTSCAQSKYGIRKTNAFFKEHSPGNVPVDEQGNSMYHGPDTVNTIFIETSGSNIKWLTAWKNGKSFTVTTIAMNEMPVQVGTDKISNEKIVLRPAQGNKLWLLQLQKAETPVKPPVKMKAGEIILQGRSGKKTFIHRISWQTELLAMPSV